MPTTIKSENWDGVTAPALPSGWTADSGLATTAAVSRSAANSLQQTASLATGRSIYYSSAQDGNSGDAQATVSAQVNQAVSSAQVTCRVTSAPFTTCYHAALNRAAGGVQLFRRVADTSTQLGSTVTVTITTSVWYRIRLRCQGTTISVEVQRDTDSQYLTSAGAWSATQQDCISQTDANVTGQGYAGLRLLAGAAATDVYADDFLFEALDPVPATTATLTGPSSGVVNVASTNFTVALNGTYTGTITPATGGAGTFSPSSLTWAGTSESQAFTYTPTTTSGSPHSVSISASPSLSYSGSPVAYTVTTSPVTVATDDAAIFWSPYNWRANGSTDQASATPAAYCRLRFTGTSLKANLSSPAFTGTSLRIRCIVDDVETYNTAVANGTTQPTLATGLADTTHEAKIFYDASDPTQDVWSNNPPTMSLRITGFVIDAGKAASASTLRSGRMLWLGDSVSYGIAVLRSTSHPAGNAGSLAPGHAVAQAFDCEIGILGFGSQGYGKTGLGNVTAVWNGSSTGSWDKYSSGVSRLSAGLFSPAPDHIVCYHGTADYTGSASDANVTAGVTGLLPALRTAAPNAKIWVVVPANRQKLSAITSGFDAAAGTKTTVGTAGQATVYRGSTDRNAWLIDLGAELSSGVAGPSGGSATWTAIDSIHPDAPANGRIAASIVAAMRLALAVGGVGRGRAVNAGGI